MKATEIRRIPAGTLMASFFASGAIIGQWIFSDPEWLVGRIVVERSLS